MLSPEIRDEIIKKLINDLPHLISELELSELLKTFEKSKKYKPKYSEDLSRLVRSLDIDARTGPSQTGKICSKCRRPY